MKREMRSRRVYEYPRGGLYRESNAENQAWPLSNNVQGGPPNNPTGAARGGGGGRGRGGQTRGGGSGNSGQVGQGAGTNARAPQPERYSGGYDPVRQPNHLKEKIGKVVFNRELARAGGKPGLAYK